MHDRNPSDVANDKRLIKKTTDYLRAATSRIAAYPKASDLKEITKLPLDPRPQVEEHVRVQPPRAPPRTPELKGHGHAGLVHGPYHG